jgi:hypothetical protein
MPEIDGKPATFIRDDVEDVMFRDEEVRWHGGGAEGRGYVYPGRQMVAGNYPHPHAEVCEDYSGTGEWVANGRVLVCRGCGLDCT